MKKIFIITVLLMSMFLLVACSKEESTPKVTNNNDNTVHEFCARNALLEDGTITLNYDIYYVGDVLKKVDSYEEIVTDDADILNQYFEAYEMIHDYYKGLKYYDAKVVKEGNKVVSTILIDYENINIDELIAIEGEEDNIFEDKIPKVSKWKELAKKLGAECEVVE